MFSQGIAFLDFTIFRKLSPHSLTLRSIMPYICRKVIGAHRPVCYSSGKLRGLGLVALKWLLISICGAKRQFFRHGQRVHRAVAICLLNSRVTFVSRLFQFLLIVFSTYLKRFGARLTRFIRIFVSLAFVNSGKKLSHECFSR
jgi:hypothetical protein